MDSTEFQINSNRFITHYLSNILEMDYYFINSDNKVCFHFPNPFSANVFLLLLLFSFEN